MRRSPSARGAHPVRHVICMIRCISDWLMNRAREHSRFERTNGRHLHRSPCSASLSRVFRGRENDVRPTERPTEATTLVPNCSECPHPGRGTAAFVPQHGEIHGSPERYPSGTQTAAAGINSRERTPPRARNTQSRSRESDGTNSPVRSLARSLARDRDKKARNPLSCEDAFARAKRIKEPCRRNVIY